MVEAFQNALRMQASKRTLSRLRGWGAPSIRSTSEIRRCRWRRRYDCRAFLCPASKTCVRRALRRCGAAYAVAAGACDIALALGVEKLERHGIWRPSNPDEGSRQRPLDAVRVGAKEHSRNSRSLLCETSCSDGGPQAGHGTCFVEEPRERCAQNPKAHIRKRVTIDQILSTRR